MPRCCESFPWRDTGLTGAVRGCRNDLRRVGLSVSGHYCTASFCTILLATEWPQTGGRGVASTLFSIRTTLSCWLLLVDPFRPMRNWAKGVLYGKNCALYQQGPNCIKIARSKIAIFCGLTSPPRHTNASRDVTLSSHQCTPWRHPSWYQRSGQQFTLSNIKSW